MTTLAVTSRDKHSTPTLESQFAKIRRPASVRKGLQVHKFGSSSLASAAHFQSVIEILLSHSNPQDVIVVSSAGPTMDWLSEWFDGLRATERAPREIACQLRFFQLDLIRALLPSERAAPLIAQFENEFDRLQIWLGDDQMRNEVLGFGEVWAARLLSVLLNHEQASADFVDSRTLLRAEEAYHPTVDAQRSRSLLNQVVRKHRNQRIVITGSMAASLNPMPLLPIRAMHRTLVSRMLVAVLIISGCGFAFAQFGRRHSVVKAGKLSLLPASKRPSTAPRVSIDVRGADRVITSNGIPAHNTGAFPNRGNPNRIQAQSYRYTVPANPQQNRNSTPLTGVFGVAINGVPFDPGAAEFYMGQMGSKWQYEPLSGAIALGIDASHAHVQPNGAYHYHGLPSGLLDSIKLNPKQHSPLVGWAADGFPIYAMYGYADPKNAESKIVNLRSSFQLREGRRPGGREPTGTYDGTFVADYVFVDGSGNLDDCNGRFCVTPEFPQGTFAYFLTQDWPVIPRNFRGTPSQDFAKHGPGAGGPGMRPGMGPLGQGRPGIGPPGFRGPPPGRRGGNRN